MSTTVAVFLLLSIANAETSVLVANSLCGLVNRVDGTLFREFAIEKQERNHYLDPDYALFMNGNDERIFNLDYCGFAVGEDSIQIDVLCDELVDCVCTTYFKGTKCSSCTIMELGEETMRGFPYPVSCIHADCSGISEEWPNCEVLPDGDDEDNYPDIHGCLDLSNTIRKPLASNRDVASGALCNDVLTTLLALTLLLV